MVAGLNVIGRIWKIDYEDDDSSGGAIITGTVCHDNVRLRVQQKPEEQLLLQQGLETLKTFTAICTPVTLDIDICTPVTLDIDERYELEIMLPQSYYLAEQRLRIVNHRPADFPSSDGRNYVMLTLNRSHRAHGLQ
ncbi:MAG: hypothetical protein ACXADH_18935 [Candidatus Kariarchaeaceae archaeon]|jgi:hypothetical protein